MQIVCIFYKYVTLRLQYISTDEIKFQYSGHWSGLQGSTHRADPARTQGGGLERPSVWGCQVIIRKAWPWTIVGDVIGE